MPKAVNLASASLLPLACLCLSANIVTKDRQIVIGPLLEGEKLQVQLRLYKGNYPSTYKVYFDANGPGFPEPMTGFAQSSIGELREENGYGYFSSYLPGTLMKAGSLVRVEMGICKETYRRGIDASRLPFRFQRDFQIKKGGHFFHVEEDGLFETQNQVYHIDEALPAMEVLSHDAYDVRGLCHKNDIGGRKVPLDSLYVDYFGFGALPSSGGNAELRLLNYRDDFSSVATKVGDYSSLPLSLSVLKEKGDTYRYRFALKDSFYYSRIDFKASRHPFREEPYFQSNSFFLPLREGHDEGAYRFQIVLEKAGAFEDTLVLENEAYSSRSYFGNCLDSEYCVVVGEAGA